MGYNLQGQNSEQERGEIELGNKVCIHQPSFHSPKAIRYPWLHIQTCQMLEGIVETDI